MHKGYESLNEWFELSRSSWLTLPRVMMHEMPDKWQLKMAKLLTEWDEMWPNMPNITTQVMLKKNNKFIKTPEHLINYRRPNRDELKKML